MFYLILHKVRGEPAFDIADKLQIGDEEGWIIPTSGHRAYPYKIWPIDPMRYQYDGIPPEWPDHYEIDKGSKPPSSFNIMSIISPMMTKIKRRL
jgi:hypothetical protein